MALIICKECGKEVSNTAKFCPHCGYRGINKNGGGFGITSIVMGIFAGLYAFAAGVSNYFSPQSTIYGMIWTILLGIMAVGFGLVSLKKRGTSKNSFSGILLGTIAMLISIAFTVF